MSGGPQSGYNPSQAYYNAGQMGGSNILNLVEMDTEIKLLRG